MLRDTCIHMCVRSHECVFTCVGVCAHVEARGQIGVSFLRCCQLASWDRSLMAWSSPGRLGCQPLDSRIPLSVPFQHRDHKQEWAHPTLHKSSVELTWHPTACMASALLTEPPTLSPFLIKNTWFKILVSIGPCVFFSIFFSSPKYYLMVKYKFIFFHSSWWLRTCGSFLVWPGLLQEPTSPYLLRSPPPRSFQGEVCVHTLTPSSYVRRNLNLKIPVSKFYLIFILFHILSNFYFIHLYLCE